jgi:hypothetical protein
MPVGVGSVVRPVRRREQRPGECCWWAGEAVGAADDQPYPSAGFSAAPESYYWSPSSDRPTSTGVIVSNFRASEAMYTAALAALGIAAGYRTESVAG